MLLTKNIAWRYREWIDSRTGEPDLVPRFRRVWTAPRVEPVPPQDDTRPELSLRHQPVQASPGA